jgi:dTDP-4-dehydrorhamnose 3,5-epimerase
MNVPQSPAPQFEVTKLRSPGLLEVRLKVHRDERGTFAKTFHEGAFNSLKLGTRFQEEFYTVSRRDVIRGLHFQVPPYDHDKLVWCLDGAVLDVAVDLRVGSPTYGRCEAVELSGERANLLWIPRGFAHGFCVLSEHASMMYKVTSHYSPEHDTGIRWDSVDLAWPVAKPILSRRDLSLPRLQDFKSPFVYVPEKA